MNHKQQEGQDTRLTRASDWAARTLGISHIEPVPVSGDASFRRYFRFDCDGRSIVLMDAPPDKEDSTPFVDIAGRLRSAGLRAPEILHFDLAQGFGLLEDFGDTLYRELLNENTADSLFEGLFDILKGFASDVDAADLPQYDAAFLQTELDLFPDWYLARHRNRPLSASEQAIWTGTSRLLIHSAQRQPQIFVHRDFHSCNLLLTPAGPGIIDFQDGMHGPLSYDFASLLWDRYVAWPREKLLIWMEAMHRRFGLETPLEQWVRDCDWMGLQRNLKIVGIFARLKYRDNKDGYLEMIPRFYQYLLDVTSLYPEFDTFHKLLEKTECAP